MPSPLPRRARFRSNSVTRCARPNCFLDAVARFEWHGNALAYCADHSEDKALSMTVAWVSESHLACPVCGRILPRALATQEHFNLQGAPCPPVLVAG